MKLALFIIIGCYVAPVRADLVETIIYTQYDEEFNFCPDGADDARSAPLFVGESDFFDSYFSELIVKVDEHSAYLKSLDITRQSYAPSRSIMNGIYLDLMANNTYNQIQKVEILLGEDSELVFCYEQGVLISCVDERQYTLYAASSDTWTYRHECMKWQAHLVDTAVRYRPDTHLTKVVFSIEVDIQHIDINQCPDSQTVTVADTSLCSPDISTCKFINGSGFVAGSYSCQCKFCDACGSIDGQVLSDPEMNATVLLDSHCIPPKEPEPIVLLQQSEMYVLWAFNGVCMVLCLVFALIVLGFRTSPVINSANLSVLELILLGAICKYAMLTLMLWIPTELFCYLIPCLTEFSFISMYGAIVIKMYTNIAVGKGKAVVSNCQIVKPWLVAAILILIYLAAWIASTLSYSWYGVSLVTTAGGEIAETHCLVTAWSYVTEVAEVLFICYGLVLCIIFLTRPQSSLFTEVPWYAAVLLIQLVLSLAYYILWPLLELEAYGLLVATLVYHHLTAAATVLLVFCPKFHYIWIGSKGADIGDSIDDEIDIEDGDFDDVKTKLTEAKKEILTLRTQLGMYESKQSSSHSSPLPSKVKGKASHGDEQELELLNPPEKEPNSSNQVSF